MMYVANRSKLGHLQSPSSQPVQSFLATNGCGANTSACAEIHSVAFWNVAVRPALYVWGWNDKLRGYGMTNGQFQTTPFAQSSMTSEYPGGGITVSSHGSTAGTGIVWATTSLDNTNTFIGHDIVRAFDALTLVELWNSEQNPARDSAGGISKFAQPVVADGKVFVPTFANQLLVYGLLPVK